MTRPHIRHALIAAVFVCLAAGTAAAVDDVALSTLGDDRFESGSTAPFGFELRADGISADGTTDVVFVAFPDTYAGNISFSNAAVQNRTSGETVPISSSTSVVDGPDGDGVRETLRTGLSHDADYATDEVVAKYSLDLTHPIVESTTRYDVTVTVEDSATATATTAAADAITVLAEGTTVSPTATPGERGTETGAGPGVGTTTGDASDGTGADAADGDGPGGGATDGGGDATGGDTDGPGGDSGGSLPVSALALVVLVAVAALGVLAARR